MTVARRWQMVRVSAGDYLLPSNDTRTLWRIYSYEEHGDAEIGDGRGGWRPLRGTFWACARYERPFGSFDVLTEWDLLEWGNWLTWETTLATRREAVDAALSANV